MPLITAEDFASIEHATGFNAYVSVFGLLFVPIFLFAVFYILRAAHLAFIKKQTVNVTWLYAWVIYLVLAIPFGITATVSTDGNSDISQLYGIPFLWLFGFLIFIFRKKSKKKLLIAMVIITVLTAPFLFYVALPISMRFIPGLNGIEIPIPFTDSCINLVTTFSSKHSCYWDAAEMYFSIF